jgi:hypothetical protein
MKYTKDDLAKMSDFEINTALLDAAKIKWQVSAVDDEVVMTNSCSDVFDFNDWALIMPLAVEHDVTYLKDDEAAYHQAHRLNGCFEFNLMVEDKSPQRAIACCLILVLQERQQ